MRMKKDVKREETIKKVSKKRSKRRKRRVLSFFLFLLFLLLCLGAVLSVTILFPVENITVSGNSVYSSDEIIKASAVTADDNLILLSEENTKMRIARELPKSGKIVVKKVFPDTVKITVESAVPAYFLSTEDGYCIADTYYKATEYKAEIPADCVYIKTSQQPQIKLGERVVFSQQDAELINTLLELTADKPFKVTGIDVSNGIDLKIALDNKFVVSFGGSVDLDKKITHLEAMYEKLSPEAQGLIILSNWTSSNRAATFRDTKVNVMDFCEVKISAAS